MTLRVRRLLKVKALLDVLWEVTNIDECDLLSQELSAAQNWELLNPDERALVERAKREWVRTFRWWPKAKE